MRSRLAGLTIVAATLIGCAGPTLPTAARTPTAGATGTAAPTGPATAVEGGCGGTQVFAGPGPDPGLGLAENPWASASPGSAGIVAYFWFPPPSVLFAAGPDGSGTKVLWVTHGAADGPLVIVAHPLDTAAPLLRFSFPPALSPAGNYPSDVAVPTPGCWRFELTVGGAQGTLDILVVPARTP